MDYAAMWMQAEEDVDRAKDATKEAYQGFLDARQAWSNASDKESKAKAAAYGARTVWAENHG